MPNHYAHAITLYPRFPDDDDDFDPTPGLLAWATKPCRRLRPVPAGISDPNPDYLSEEEYAWRVKNWRTKWDTYEHKVIPLGGDGSPMLVTFQTAWSPPAPEIRAEMIEELRKLARSAVWIGMEPYDNTCHVLATLGEEA
jgi:hypothetical protein